jgi:hypothetical protein
MDFDFSFISSFFHDTFLFFVYLADFLTGGLYDLITDSFSFLVQKITIWSIELTILSLQFSYDVAKSMLVDLNISAILNATYVTFDSNTLFYLTAVRFPEIVNNLLSGLATGFVMGFLPR